MYARFGHQQSINDRSGCDCLFELGTLNVYVHVMLYARLFDFYYIYDGGCHASIIFLLVVIVVVVVVVVTENE
ncbi:hypothetical protein IWX49DRAFT_560351 [Phyllosticta citricarpa]|uniref:Transmembrane protein n=1 Tax=Phyllosticta paracitricarpa TaxID=2016321 RepID=A0ABR1N6A4_9PEZI